MDAAFLDVQGFVPFSRPCPTQDLSQPQELKSIGSEAGGSDRGDSQSASTKLWSVAVLFGQCHEMLDKRAQGRPARGTATVGPQKIIEGMQDALRALHTNNVTRKDIARFAGVTPALVTYYFPERNTLIEAATLPVIDSLTLSINQRLLQNVDPRSKLLQIVTDILSCYLKDIAIVELYVSHRRSLADGLVHDGVQEMFCSITAFFDEWLSRCPKSDYDGRFLTNALLGICRSLAYHHRPDSSPVADQGIQQHFVLGHAEMICRILVGDLSGSKLQALSQIDFETASHAGGCAG